MDHDKNLLDEWLNRYRFIYEMSAIQQSADNNTDMDVNIPILNNEQIGELKQMVSTIIDDNQHTIEQVLSKNIDFENTTILNLYNLVLQEWKNKQKVIDNVCHFSLSMMESIQYLWDQKYEKQQKIKNQEAIIDNLQKDIHYIAVRYQNMKEQNEAYKNRAFYAENKINEAEIQIQSISCQKSKFQELYKSYSCCDLTVGENIQEGMFVDKKQNQKKACSMCLQLQLRMKEQQQRLNDWFNSELSKQCQQIQYLKEDVRQSEKRYDDMLEQYNLMKMQVQLAQIAIKDVSQRALSLNNSMISRSDELNGGKSYDQFINGDLECISNFNDSFISQRNINHSRISLSSNQVNVQWNFNAINNSMSHYQHQNVHPIAFKKKNQIKVDSMRMKTEPNLEHKISFQTEPSFKKSILKPYQYQKTVTIQCDLLKNVPKIKFFTKDKPKIKKNQYIATKTLKSEINVENLQIQERKVKTISKSQIMPPKMLKSKQKKEEPQPLGGPLHKFFSFFSNKVITNRIKTK